MKTLPKLIIGIVVISLLLTACAKTEEIVEKTSETANEIQRSEEVGNENRNPNSIREQEPPNLYGRVKSIIGNEVVLELVEMPTMEVNQQRNGEAGQRSINEVAMGGAMPAGPVQGGMGGQRPGGNREINLTGETRTLLIPVGVPITTFGSDDSKQLDIGDIYAGTFLQIWFDKNDEERIIQVRMIQGR